MIDRRRFLTAGACLGFGLSRNGLLRGSTPADSGPAPQKRSVHCPQPVFSQHTPALGNSEPLPPHRVAILRTAGDAEKAGQAYRWVSPEHRGLVDEIIGWTAPIRRACQSTDKIGLIVRIMEILAAHYQVPNHLKPWAKTMAAQEALAESQAMDHVAMPPCFQQTGLVRTDNPVADWWLFLVPNGYAAWQSHRNPDAEPLHLMVVQVVADPASSPSHFDVLVRARLRFRMHVHGAEWIGVSRMNEANAAHVVGRLITKASRISWEE
jgi:hypothetical protein